MTRDEYNHWLAVARRAVHKQDDAEDLLQEALIAAIKANRSKLSTPGNSKWLRGTLRNLAAMQARTSARRRERENIPPRQQSAMTTVPTDFLQSLPPAPRKVATLITAGLSREEILSILRLTPTAFRQRLTTIRKAWNNLGSQVLEDSKPASHLSLGAIRRVLVGILRGTEAFGAHDPDGHLIIISKSSSQKLT